MECKEGVSEGELNIYIIIIKEGQQQKQWIWRTQGTDITDQINYDQIF